MRCKVGAPNHTLQRTPKAARLIVQFAALMLLHKSRATSGAAELGVMPESSPHISYFCHKECT